MASRLCYGMKGWVLAGSSRIEKARLYGQRGVDTFLEFPFNILKVDLENLFTKNLLFHIWHETWHSLFYDRSSRWHKVNKSPFMLFQGIVERQWGTKEDRTAKGFSAWNIWGFHWRRKYVKCREVQGNKVFHQDLRVEVSSQNGLQVLLRSHTALRSSVAWMGPQSSNM